MFYSLIHVTVIFSSDQAYLLLAASLNVPENAYLHPTLHLTPTTWNVGNSTAAHDVGAALQCRISSESSGGVSFGVFRMRVLMV